MNPSNGGNRSISLYPCDGLREGEYDLGGVGRIEKAGTTMCIGPVLGPQMGRAQDQTC